MATWQEVRERLLAEYALDTDDENELSLTFERRHGATDRAQRVMIRTYTAWGRPMIEIRSAFGPAGALDPATALADNLTLPLGAIALHGKFLVLVHKAPLGDLTPETVVFLAARLSLLADALEERLGTDRF